VQYKHNGGLIIGGAGQCLAKYLQLCYLTHGGRIMRIHEYFATIIVVFSLILASCASHTAVYPDPVNIQSVIQPGDTVKIVTKDNQETEFVVAEVTDEAIVGENIEVPLNDIMGMKQETVSAGENALIITILTLGVASAAILSPPLPYAETRPESEAIISTLEEVPGWVKGCTPDYPMYHSGDMYATGHSGDMYATGLVGIYAVEYIGIDERLCIEQCDSKYMRTCSDRNEGAMQKHYKSINSCGERFRRCKYKCIEKGHPTGEIAEHIMGGFYSDKSYYAMCKNPFENIHPTKDKYEKTKWQKDRDECMKLTFENIKPNFWNQTETPRFFNRSKKYYRECLSERGYSIRLY